MEPDAISMGTSSDVSEGPPPSYDNEWEKDSLELDMGKSVLLYFLGESWTIKLTKLNTAYFNQMHISHKLIVFTVLIHAHLCYF